LAFYLNTQRERPARKTQTPTLETAYIFTEADGVVSSLEVKPCRGWRNCKIAAQRGKCLGGDSAIEAEADQGLAEAAATQLTALPISRSNRRWEIPRHLGLDNPAYVITIEFKDGKNRTLEVGDVTPTNSGYYVRVDKDRMMITDLSGIDALLQLGFFPPY